MVSSKNSTNTSEEFYSPNASVDEKKASVEEKIVDHNGIIDKLEEKEKKTILEKVTEDETEEVKEKIGKDENESEVDQKLAQSPRARRSYKSK